MSPYRVLKCASAAAIGTISLMALVGIANAEAANQVSTSNHNESTSIIEINNTSITNIHSTNSVSTVNGVESSQNITPGTATEVKQEVNAAVSETSESASKSDNSFSNGNGKSSGHIGNGSEIGKIKINGSSFATSDTTLSAEQKLEQTISAIATKINDSNLGVQKSSSGLTGQPVSKANPVAPVSPAIPVEPQSPAGLLQQLSLVLSQSPAVSLIAVFSQPELYLPLLFMAMLVILSIFASKPFSLFVQFLRNSGYAGAARSDETLPGYYLFATPLKMSFITMRMH